MKKSAAKFAIQQALKESYGKVGSTADKFLKLFFKKIDLIK